MGSTESAQSLMSPRAEKTNGEAMATFSAPAKMQRRQEALFRSVLKVLEKAHLPYVVAGTFALRQHTGVGRCIKDLDVFMTAQNASEALQHLQNAGFECEVCDPVWLAKAHRDGYFVDLITGMSNGVFAVDDSWIERASPAKVCGVNSRVLAPEELLVSKLFVTRRERFDGADIAHIIFASRSALQWERILQLTGEHWEILLWSLVLFRYVYPAHTDHVPSEVWQELLARFAGEIRCPSPNARFRGSLVDEVMFAIDVNEWGLDDVLQESRSRRPAIAGAAPGQPSMRGCCRPDGG